MKTNGRSASIRVINIEEVMRFFEREARPVTLEEVYQYFGVDGSEPCHKLMEKCGKLVRQGYLIKLDKKLWRFNYEMRNICESVNHQTGRDSSNPSL